MYFKVDCDIQSKKDQFNLQDLESFNLNKLIILSSFYAFSNLIAMQ